MKKAVVRFMLVILAALAVSAMQPASAQGKTTLTIFAASSLTDAFNEIKAQYEAANPQVEIVYNFGASSALATQIREGAPADLFASANYAQMKTARDAGRIVGLAVTFARNRLVVITPGSNPAKIESLNDLANPGVKLIVAASAVPVREYTDNMLAKMAEAAEFGPAYKESFLKNIVSEEGNVRRVSAKIALGEGDAGIVYRSDVTPDIADEVRYLDIPDQYNTLATYPIAVTDNTPHFDAAQGYVNYLLSMPGQAILARWNFIPAAQMLTQVSR